jgi:hypothetical protein
MKLGFVALETSHRRLQNQHLRPLMRFCSAIAEDLTEYGR